jgi:hypothetical protein
MMIKFVTTFSENGYHVYGKSWIESFLHHTKDRDDIVAKVYVEGMDATQFNLGDKVQVVDFDTEISEHKTWLDIFEKESKHDDWNKKLGIKFSFKSFVMMDALSKNDGYVVWLDADCTFESDDFDDFPEDMLQGKFMAAQRENGSEHMESGIVCFNAGHPDKSVFVDKLRSFYMNPEEFNNFGQFFDGYALFRTVRHTNVSFVDLNEGYGIGGIQSDPNCTFLNPLIRKRFIHNIGITGKRKYEEWKNYVKIDERFQLIHGAQGKTVEEIIEERLKKINARLIGRFKKNDDTADSNSQ